jgi:hypothetical protein
VHIPLVGPWIFPPFFLVKQRGFSPLQKGFFPLAFAKGIFPLSFCKGIPLTWHGPLSNFTMLSAYYTIACTLAMQPCPVALPGSLARQPCSAALLGSLARQPCLAFPVVSFYTEIHSINVFLHEIRTRALARSPFLAYIEIL